VKAKYVPSNTPSSKVKPKPKPTTPYRPKPVPPTASRPPAASTTSIFEGLLASLAFIFLGLLMGDLSLFVFRAINLDIITATLLAGAFVLATPFVGPYKWYKKRSSHLNGWFVIANLAILTLFVYFFLQGLPTVTLSSEKRVEGLASLYYLGFLWPMRFFLPFYQSQIGL
jgi:hypothetical protein